MNKYNLRLAAGCYGAINKIRKNINLAILCRIMQMVMCLYVTSSSAVAACRLLIDEKMHLCVVCILFELQIN